MNLVERIETYILSNLKQPEERRIGVEVECIFYNDRYRRLPVNPGNEFSATDLLEVLTSQGISDNPRPGYTLEPGGQLEWASSPFKCLHDLQKQFIVHLKRLKEACEEYGLIQMDFALEPVYRPEDLDLINMEKYRLMHRKFTRTGKLGPWMMRNTTSVQVNIDMVSAEDAAEIAFIADCLEPFCALLFANSPFMVGKMTGKQNLRYQIWGDTDPTRCGYLMNHGIVSPKDLVRNYCEYIRQVPAIFILDQRRQAVGFNGTLGEWLSKLWDRDELTDNLVLAALHQIFTHVRFKHVLEVRGADRPPRGYELAPAAWWVGLLTATQARGKALEIINRWSLEDRKRLNRSAEILDLNQAGPGGKTVRNWLEVIGNIALEGLDERCRALKIPNERVFLEPFLENVLSNGIIALRTQRRFAASGMSLIDFLKRGRKEGMK